MLYVGDSWFTFTNVPFCVTLFGWLLFEYLPSPTVIAEHARLTRDNGYEPVLTFHPPLDALLVADVAKHLVVARLPIARR